MYWTHFCGYNGQETVKIFKRWVGGSKPTKLLVMTWSLASEPWVKERILCSFPHYSLNGVVTGCFAKF